MVIIRDLATRENKNMHTLFEGQRLVSFMSSYSEMVESLLETVFKYLGYGGLGE